jgi:putative Mg2+ transporter-C (MgtC) family protein
MWLAGAIGLALGFSHWLIAAFALAAGLTVLFAVGKLQAAFKMKPIGLEPEKVVAEGRAGPRNVVFEKKRAEGISAVRPVR